jgi:hypothetical protein
MSPLDWAASRNLPVSVKNESYSCLMAGREMRSLLIIAAFVATPVNGQEQGAVEGIARNPARNEVLAGVAFTLRPGDYIAFAFEEAQSIDEFSDLALVRPLMIHGVKVTARQGEVSEVPLRITPGGIQ